MLPSDERLVVASYAINDACFGHSRITLTELVFVARCVRLPRTIFKDPWETERAVRNGSGTCVAITLTPAWFDYCVHARAFKRRLFEAAAKRCNPHVLRALRAAFIKHGHLGKYNRNFPFLVRNKAVHLMALALCGYANEWESKSRLSRYQVTATVRLLCRWGYIPEVNVAGIVALAHSEAAKKHDQSVTRELIRECVAENDRVKNEGISHPS